MPGARPDPAVESYIASATPEVRSILDELLALVRTTLPEAQETIKWGRPVFSADHDICYVAKARTHASLGFYRGADLDDSRGLLEGSGRKLRHVKVGVGAAVPRNALRDLLNAARDLATD